MQPAVQSRYLGAAVPGPGPDDRSWVILCSHDADLQLGRTQIEQVTYFDPGNNIYSAALQIALGAAL